VNCPAAAVHRVPETGPLLTVIQYYLYVTTMADDSGLRDRLYHAYASQHAGRGDDQAITLIYRRDIRPLLPWPPGGRVIDIGCGQGQLVKLLLADGYDAHGVDISEEQVAIAHGVGLDRVHCGHYRDMLRAHPSQLAAVTATDLLEHLTKDEVLDTFDLVMEALAPGGTFVARVPNAVSPLGGHIRYGDFTHESSYSARSVRQLAAAAGFCSVAVRPCTPVAHGFLSATRAAAWKPMSALYKIALAAETGVLRGHIVTQNLTFAACKSR
jgi:2-polyprenyl-3-methyl-5-hydroxy-6-metoxy-1,4-benzoquinol methylase